MPRMGALLFLIWVMLILLPFSCLAVSRVRAYPFHGLDGAGQAGLMMDASGNIWGIAPYGGAHGYGDVFELTRNAQRQVTEKVLYSFTNGNDGGSPAVNEQLIADSAGNLYGTTTVGGAYAAGTVFKLTPSSSGWQESVLHSFTCGSDGCVPVAGVVFDAVGNLYGTTFEGGPGGSGFGTVFELSIDSNGNWTETTLHVFSGGSDGAFSDAGVIFDHSGNLYGTAYAGGSNSCRFGGFHGCGVVFELTHSGSGWHHQVLYTFTGGSDGASPGGGLVFDSSGNLYGTAFHEGDPACECGTVFRLTPTTTPDGQWNQTVLHSFTGLSDGAFPHAAVILDASGNLYGTASTGGTSCALMPPENCGTVFQLTPNNGGTWNLNLLYSFLGKRDGKRPGGIIRGAFHNIYGSAGEGGYFGGKCSVNGCGTIFELANLPGN